MRCDFQMSCKMSAYREIFIEISCKVLLLPLTKNLKKFTLGVDFYYLGS